MSWIAAGVAVVGGGIKMYQGYKQKQDGIAMEGDLTAPEFQIPPEIAKNMSIAEKQSYQGLPAEQKRAFLENQQRTSQTALRNSSDRRGGLGIISQIQGNENLSNRQLLVDDTNARQQNMQRAMDARSVMADYKMKRFEHQYNEYSSDLDYARAQQGAGSQNISAGMDTAIGGIGQGAAQLNANKQSELNRQNNLAIAALGGNQSNSNQSNSNQLNVNQNLMNSFPQLKTSSFGANGFGGIQPGGFGLGGANSNPLNTYIQNNPLNDNSTGNLYNKVNISGDGSNNKVQIGTDMFGNPIYNTQF